MTITAKVIAATKFEKIKPIYTVQARYPRFIHSEVMTHRVFGRNASSSRAVPIAKMIQDVLDDPAMPVSWGSNKPGMQAGEELDHFGKEACIAQWLAARDFAVERARVIAAEGAHKQIVNRLLEPFAHITVIITATEWQNFFDLRCHPAADPTMRVLAETIRDAIQAATPEFGLRGAWHLPYVGNADLVAVQERGLDDTADIKKRTLRLISAARCARVSYLNHDGSNPDFDKDLELANRLLADKHMSPFEHQATPDPNAALPDMWGNLQGWVQSRKLFEVNL